MDLGSILQANLLSPMVLAFLLGALATIIKSDLSLPEGLYTSLSMYLLFAIGLKGGVELSLTPIEHIIWPVLATIALSLLTTGIAYFASRKLGKVDHLNSAALAAHYGSVSAVTFIAAVTFATTVKTPAEGFMPALVALLEVPALLLALSLGSSETPNQARRELIRELFTGRTILLLLGGMAIGVVSGKTGVEQVQPLFGDLFKGALTFFLLEMGLVAARRLSDLRKHALFLGLYGVGVPLVNGAIGVGIGTLAGLSAGGSGVLGAMAASASYIAAPAAVRVAIPSANPSLYLTASLAVTFPFNLVLGIPLYNQLASALAHR
ncbi:MAG: sodium-dependent bicarbonate transport family permease [Chthonomonas sp.]|nr:sodium-dependent bicarbonate transport family permease [Chthonomonas sp.]